MTRSFLPQRTIEERASRLLLRYSQCTGKPISLPVPVDQITECLLDLKLLWEPVCSQEGREVLAKLQPMDRRVVFNENYKQLFEGTPGLERTTLAHELGHWELHFDKALLNQPTLPGLDEHVGFCVYRDGARTDAESQAHAFMGYLLMPTYLLSPLLQGLDLRKWPTLYALRDEFQVTISALKVRLEKMGLLYVDADGGLHDSKGVCDGQMRLT